MFCSLFNSPGWQFPAVRFGFFFPRPALYLTYTIRLKSICAQSPAQCAARRILRLPRCHCPGRRRTDRSLRLTHNLLGSRLLFSLVSGTPRGVKTDVRSGWVPDWRLCPAVCERNSPEHCPLPSPGWLVRSAGLGPECCGVKPYFELLFCPEARRTWELRYQGL